jgi:hypothetical protein
MKKFIVIFAAALVTISLWWYGSIAIVVFVTHYGSLSPAKTNSLTYVWFILLCIVMWKVSKKILKKRNK